MEAIMKHDELKGNVKDNYLKALVRSELYKKRVVKDKTKFSRKVKHKNPRNPSDFSFIVHSLIARLKHIIAQYCWAY